MEYQQHKSKNKIKLENFLNKMTSPIIRKTQNEMRK